MKIKPIDCTVSNELKEYINYIEYMRENLGKFLLIKNKNNGKKN